MSAITNSSHQSPQKSRSQALLIPVGMIPRKVGLQGTSLLAHFSLENSELCCLHQRRMPKFYLSFLLNSKREFNLIF